MEMEESDQALALTRLTLKILLQNTFYITRQDQNVYKGGNHADFSIIPQQ